MKLSPLQKTPWIRQIAIDSVFVITSDFMADKRYSKCLHVGRRRRHSAQLMHLIELGHLPCHQQQQWTRPKLGGLAKYKTNLERVAGHLTVLRNVIPLSLPIISIPSLVLYLSRVYADHQQVPDAAAAAKPGNWQRLVNSSTFNHPLCWDFFHFFRNAAAPAAEERRSV